MRHQSTKKKLSYDAVVAEEQDLLDQLEASTSLINKNVSDLRLDVLSSLSLNVFYEGEIDATRICRSKQTNRKGAIGLNSNKSTIIH